MAGVDSEQDFKCTKHEQDGRTVLLLEGVINERTDLNQIFADVTGDQIIIDLKGITRINSCGVRDWVNALKPMADKATIHYTGCSRAIVDQMNMIFNFLSSGKIVSFYAPYYCDECDQEFDMLIEVDEHFPDEEDREDPEAPDFDCPTSGCGKTMEFNEDEEKYFYFLREDV